MIIILNKYKLFPSYFGSKMQQLISSTAISRSDALIFFVFVFPSYMLYCLFVFRSVHYAIHFMLFPCCLFFVLLIKCANFLVLSFFMNPYSHIRSSLKSNLSSSILIFSNSNIKFDLV